jgi:hypothetical protein
MKRIAILAAALVAVAACNKSNGANTTDTATAGGAVAPASTDSTGAMSSGSSMSPSSSSTTSGSTSASSSMSDTSHMSGSSMHDSTRMRDSSHMRGSRQMGDSSSAQNQTQSGVTDSTGHSTLGKNVKKLSPTSGAAVTAKGDTLKKKPSSTP